MIINKLLISGFKNVVRIICLLFICTIKLNAQYTLHTTDTTFKYKFSNEIEKKVLRFTNDTIRINTNAYQNSFIVYGNNDSIVVTQDKTRKLEDQHTYITIFSPSKKVVVRATFWAMNHEFSNKYIRKQIGKSTFELPEIYELANIVLTLACEPLNKPGYILSNTGYYKEVLAHFKPFQNHPAIQALGFKDDNELGEKYFSFRENSYCFKIDRSNRIVKNGQYHKVFYTKFSSIFEDNIGLLNDFIKQSNFRSFYKKHQSYYDALLKKTEAYMPMKKMWKWVESEFPQRSQSYKTIISPLIDGNHSTINYTWLGNPNKPFRESLMFVCGSERYEGKSEYTDKQIEGFLSGVVFTEIDHNYVNPTSDKYLDRINKIFAKREIWAVAGKPGDSYKTPYTVFNEYMTHALFFIYLLDIGFTGSDYELVRNRRIAMNEDRRGFRLFTKFTDHLIELYRTRPTGKIIADLYPEIFDWCEKQNITN